ncbi:CAP domain-containing protein [Marinicrinis sediminis]|uniref:CAP domain-containing protein n=1 Tax=Marinicrinis sediminis TaxID=1652465 RepID=A0ABW5R6Z9_9BACL
MQRGMKKAGVIVLICVILFAQGLVQAEAFGKGTKGPDVYAAQGMLKTLGYYGGAIDGVYGAQMVRGVKYFQYKYGLPVTGSIDGKTLESILWAYGNLKIQKQPAPKQPTPAPTPAPSIKGLTPEEQKMVNLVNQERLKAGVGALKADLALTKVARVKSSDMINKNYFSHQSPTYGSPFDMMKQFGISYRTAGENIACNQTVDKAHQALMNSSGHRKNILSGNFNHVGIGIVNGGACGKMFTQMFIGK